MTPAVLLAVVGVHLLAAMSPGPSFVVCVRTAVAQGFWAAAALALGYGIGAAVWAAAALAGLALLFQVVPPVLLALKVLGGAYLIWIAVRMWQHAGAPVEADGATAPRSARAAVRFGVLTFMTNPKPAVFFGAVFVGLVPPETSLAWKSAIVAVIFIDETLWYLLVARALSLSAPRAAYLRLKASLDRVFGVLLGVLGLEIALT
ncbi:LysE family translocator [Rubellimicrobium arenae]|uniref:LysE family translocator n=1 Tax=Rubellimicrobium arenae TaxID=2817372 RepID=UPI001B307662|nr:LysE family transporter [Rubellimicrobium arenae]